MSELTAECLREILHYDPSTGIFSWKIKTNNRFKFKSPAGNVNATGYVHIRIRTKQYKAHRLAWLYTFGVWPKGQIDHINRIRSDNRIANLRDSTAISNSQNRKKAKENPGAYYKPLINKWESRITINRKQVNLGCFPSAELASKAYLKAKAEFHSV